MWERLHEPDCAGSIEPAQDQVHGWSKKGRMHEGRKRVMLIATAILCCTQVARLRRTPFSYD
jgi:hypothetical protein